MLPLQHCVQAALAALEDERAAAAALEREAAVAWDRAALPALEDDGSNLSDEDTPLHNEAGLVARLLRVSRTSALSCQLSSISCPPTTTDGTT